MHDARATHCVDLTESPSCAIVTDTMSGHHRRTRDTGLPTRVCLKPPQGLITRSCNFGRVGGVWPHRAPDTGLFKAPGANHPNASQLRAGRGGLATQGTREPKRKTKPPRSTAKPGPGAGNKLCARQSDQQRLLLRMLASACTAASRRRRPSRRCQQWHPARAPAASRAPAKRPAAPAAPSGRSTQASATRRAPPSRKRRPSRRCQQRPAQGAGSQPRARQSDQQRACCSDLATQASASRRAAVHRRVENEDELPLSTEAPGPGAGSQPPVKATSTSSSISKH